MIEGVQKRATKMVPELKNLEYTDRRQAMKLPSMYYRREREDMIECYKITHDMYKSEPLISLGRSPQITKERDSLTPRRPSIKAQACQVSFF